MNGSLPSPAFSHQLPEFYAKLGKTRGEPGNYAFRYLVFLELSSTIGYIWSLGDSLVTLPPLLGTEERGDGLWGALLVGSLNRKGRKGRKGRLDRGKSWSMKHSNHGFIKTFEDSGSMNNLFRLEGPL